MYRYDFGQRMVLRVDDLARNPAIQGVLPLAYELENGFYPLDLNNIGGYITADALLYKPYYVAPIVAAPILLILLIMMLITTSSGYRQRKAAARRRAFGVLENLVEEEGYEEGWVEQDEFEDDEIMTEEDDLYY